MAKDAAIILLTVLTLFAVLSWASAPNAAEMARADARATIAPLSTTTAQQAAQIAILRAQRTPLARICPPGYSPC